MITRFRIVFTLLFFPLILGACTSHEASTEEIVQPAEEQAAAMPAETEQALAEASSSDFTEPGEVQLDGGTDTPVDTVDNTSVQAAPDLTGESSLAIGHENISIYFSTGSALVTREYRDRLKEISGKLSSERTLIITLRGHSDHRGSAAFNRRLAMKRARAVKAVLIRLGVKSRQITIGSAQQASSGSTEEEHAQNRRVEIEFP